MKKPYSAPSQGQVPISRYSYKWTCPKSAQRTAWRGPKTLGTMTALILVPTLAWACPMCQTTLESGGPLQETNALATGYFWSILALMGTPIILVGAVTGVVLMNLRKHKQASNSSEVSDFSSSSTSL